VVTAANDDRSGRHVRWRPIAAAAAAWIRAGVRPLGRLWRSNEPVDSYALVHLGGAAGDALVALGLADSIFFSVPVGEARGRVAAYLLLTMTPLAVAGPLLVPFLDRVGPRRAISIVANLGRALLALFVAPRTGTAVLYPAVVVLLALSRIQAITRNALVAAYAGSEEALVRANARLGRFTALAAGLAAAVGLPMIALAGVGAPLYLAAAVYAGTAMLTVRLPRPRLVRERSEPVAARGRLPSLAVAAFGAATLRAASGFLLFLLAFGLRREDESALWFGVAVGAGLLGVLIADFAAPRLRRRSGEEPLVPASLLAAGASAAVAFWTFALPVLALLSILAGMASELGRLSFQSLMQRAAPPDALGRVFVRYEVVFQLAWVAGAALGALLPIGLRAGVLALAVSSLVAGAAALVWHRARSRRSSPRGPRVEPTATAGDGDGAT
jgi:hypothetical protein